MYYSNFKGIVCNLNHCVIRLVVEYGSQKGIKPGISHLLEHLFILNQIYENRSLKEIVGECGGKINAQTNRKYILFQIEIEYEFLEVICNALKKALKRLKITEFILLNEKKVIEKEIEYRNIDKDYKTYLEIYHENIGDNESILGDFSDVNSINIKDIYMIYNRFFNANNTNIIVFGDEICIKKCESFFSICKKERSFLALAYNNYIELLYNKGLFQFIINNYIKEYDLFLDDNYVYLNIYDKKKLLDIIQKDFVINKKDKIIKYIEQLYCNDKNQAIWEWKNNNICRDLYIESFVDAYKYITDKYYWDLLNAKLNECMGFNNNIVLEYNTIDFIVEDEFRKEIKSFFIKANIENVYMYVYFVFDISKLSSYQRNLLISFIAEKNFNTTYYFNEEKIKLDNVSDMETLGIIAYLNTNNYIDNIRFVYKYIIDTINATINDKNVEFNLEQNMFNLMYEQIYYKLFSKNNAKGDDLKLVSEKKQVSDKISIDLMGITIIYNDNNFDNKEVFKMFDKFNKKIFLQDVNYFNTNKYLKYKEEKECVHVMMGARGVSLNNNEKLAYHIIWKMLSSSDGLINQNIRDKKGNIYFSKAFSQEFFSKGIFIIYFASSKKDYLNNINIIKGILNDISENINKYEKQVANAKKALMLDYNKMCDKDKIYNVIIKYVMYDDGISIYKRYLNDLKFVSNDSIMATARKILNNIIIEVKGNV